MGQKVNTHGLRVGVIKDWDSRWYARNEKVGDLLVEDKKIRDYLKKTLYSAGIPKIEIERDNAMVRFYLHCARPGVVIGKGGEQIEQYRLAGEKLIGKKVRLNIVEVLSTCPTNWGFSPGEAMKWLEENMIPYYPLGVYKDKGAE